MDNNVKNHNDMNSNHTSIIGKIGSFIYFLIVSSLILIIVLLFYQQITDEDKIPNIFGYKMFMIGKEYMDDSLTEGDLIFTKNLEPASVNVGDIIAFRNVNNLVTIHKVIEIDTTENREVFITNAAENEVKTNKNVSFSKLEGKLVYKIPLLGKIILFIINPIVITCTIVVILIVGYILYKIAKNKEAKEDKNTEEESKTTV